MRQFGTAFGCVVSVLLAALSLAACSGDDDGSTEPNPAPDIPESVASVTLDEVGCTYEGDETPKAPFFYMDTNNLVSSYSFFEVDRIPADVTTQVVEAFFNRDPATLKQGVGFPGVPADWRLMRRTGMQTGTGGMLVGDPMPGNPQQLVAGQRYVVWCSTGEPPSAVFLAAVIEAT